MEFIQEANRFYICNESQELLAEITWQQDDENRVLIADHTFVDDRLRGQGVARQLLDRLVEFAKELDYRIVPVCSYVVSQFDKVESYQEIDARKVK